MHTDAHRYGDLKVPVSVCICGSSTLDGARAAGFAVRVYVIDDYNVPGPTGHSVRIVWRGLPPVIWAGLTVPVLILCLLIFVVVVSLAAEFARMQGPLLLVASFGFFFILFSVLRRQVAPECPLELTWEARDRELLVSPRGAIPLMSTPLVIPFDRIRVIEFQIGSEGRKEVQIRCRVIPMGSAPIDVPMTIRHVDRRAKALDLALRIGAAMGYQGYRITKCTPRSLRIELTRMTETGPRVGAIPSKDDDPNYEAASTDRLPDVPSYEVPSFQPGTFNGPFRVLAWEPGREVRFERAPPSPASLVIETIVWAFAGFVIAMLVASVCRNYPPRDDPASSVCVLSGTYIFVVLCLLVRQWTRGRKRVVIDWSVREVRIDGFLAHSVTPFRDLRSIVLRGHTSAVTASGGTQPWAWNWCELVLWTDTWAIVIPGPRYQGDADTPMDVMLPMAVDLAKALGLPWTWHDYAIPPGTA